jgi:hypothetical protein
MRARQQWLLLAAAVAAASCCCRGAAAAAGPGLLFPVFEPCADVPGSGSSVGMCRRAARAPGGGVSAAAVRTFPIDMRLPCEDAAIPCSEVRAAGTAARRERRGVLRLPPRWA